VQCASLFWRSKETPQRKRQSPKKLAKEAF